MQALTMAIGPAGIDYFAQRLVAPSVVGEWNRVRLNENIIALPTFKVPFVQTASSEISQMKIQLSNGTLSGFAPRYESISQIAGGKFPMLFSARNFTANYDWHESYQRVDIKRVSGRSKPSYPQGKFKYAPGIGLWTIDVMLEFSFKPSKGYELMFRSTGETKSSSLSANFPAESVIQKRKQNEECFASKASELTHEGLMQFMFQYFKSIPASGALTTDIYYEFALGDSGLKFPEDNKGIKIGMIGKVRYRDQEYTGQTPPTLPVPPPPTDKNHVQVYVSDYLINALHWAYYKAGLLTTRYTPSQPPHPDVLKVATYASAIQALKPYENSEMNALVVPQQAPVTTFQEVYQFTTEAMKSLDQRLPSDVYQRILEMEDTGYAAWAKVVEALETAEVPTQHNDTIRNATKGMGMVVKQDLKFTLTIQNGEPEQPNIIFSVARTDILNNLGLGITGNAQTLKFGFRRVEAVATFISSTVPELTKNIGRSFGTLIWPVLGEPQYNATLKKMGETGVPITIMSGFQFLFEEAKLSVQQGFVSILAKVRV